MKYTKSKLSYMRCRALYFLVKFGLVLIYILKVHRKKSSSILLRKNMSNSLLAFIFWKTFTISSILQTCNISIENPETTLRTFLSKFSSEIYLSQIINYCGRIFTLYLMWGAFSLVCVLSIFFFLFLFFFLFSIVFSRQRLTKHRIAGNGECIIIFLVFHFH